jgi:folate-dependent phosphoribosylglycinamide formyltransferase PurN
MNGLRLALLFQDGNFVGREYYRRLRDAGLGLDLVAAVGRMSDASVAIERARTGGKWNPPPIPPDEAVHRFTGLPDPALWALIKERAIDAAIQGGIGILKPDMLAVPTLGFVNVHPGKLPEYRGRNCPEWAILNGDDVYATAHIVDSGIDTGPVICAKRYELQPGWDYADFRAHLYAHCATVLIDALKRLDGATPATLNRIVSTQDETRARSWPAMLPDDLARTKAALATRTGS